MKGDEPTPAAARAESSPDRVVVRQMGITHAEFFRILPPVLTAMPHRIGDGVVRVKDGHRRVTMALGAEVERRLGAMRLPGFELRIRFSGYTTSEVDAFMARFDTVFHRGGG